MSNGVVLHTGFLCNDQEWISAETDGGPPPSLQLAVDVQVPRCFGGLGGQVVYIDTEGSFLLQRLLDLASAAVNHCSLLVEDEEQRVAMETFTVETILSSVFVVRVQLCYSHMTVVSL